MPQSVEPADLEARLLTPQTSLLHRCCIAVGAASGLRAESEGAWLDGACAALRSLWPSRVAAQALVAMRPPMALQWTVAHIGVSGALSHSASAAMRREALAGWDGDPAASITAWPALIDAPICSARADLIDDAAWIAGRLKPARERIGLHEFVRVIIPFNASSHQGALALQLDGIDRAWRPDGDATEALRGVAPAVFRAYFAAFVSRDLLRTRLTSLLPAERRAIAPLLAEGLSERDIARRLGRSQHTVHDWIRCAYRTWGVNTRFELREIWAGLRPAPAIPESPPRSRSAKRARTAELKPMAPPPPLQFSSASRDTAAATIDRSAFEQAMR